ncbi:MAG: hypothetical protein WD342_01380 [Verrucomicrobiales bacterium]
MNTADLIQRLHRADWAWRRTCAVEWFLRGLKFVCAAVWLVVAADLVLQLGAAARLVASLVGLLALLVFAGRFFRRAFGGGGSLLPVARVLEARDGTLGSKLINVLQLREKVADETQPVVTRKLAERAVDEAAREVEGRDFVPLTKSPTLGRTFWRAMLPVALLVLPALIFSQIASRELMRFVDPFGDHPPFSFTQLEIVTPEDDQARVVYHQPATIEVEYSGHRPRELFLTVAHADDPDNRTTIPMFAQGEDGFVQQIDQVDADLLVRAHTKTRRSISEARRIGVILWPQLEDAKATVSAPAYTRLAKRENRLGMEKATAPTLSVLAGSEVTFALRSNRPLSEGSVGLQSSDPEPLETPLRADDAERPNVARASVTAEVSGRLRFDLRDVTGLPAERELAVNLVVTHDLPPEIGITEPVSDGFIVDTFATNVAFHASDDYGLKSMRLHTGINEDFSEPKTIAMPVDPPQRDALETVRIAPSEMGAAPGDVISIFGEATDIRPDSQLARTPTLTLEVIGEEQYNDYLRMEREIRDLERKYSTLHDELRDLAREQRELAGKAAAAGENPDQATRDELAARQSELNRKLEKLAKRMESATRDQPLYDLEKDLQKVLDEEARKIRESIAQNQRDNEEFLAASPSAESMEGFSEQAEAQADRLDPAREAAEEKIAAAIRDADQIQQLLKALGAYQQAYAMQRDLAQQTAAYASRPELTRDDRLALQEMAGTERLIGEALDQIVERLRDGADNAEAAYPEAARDARDIAGAIESANLSSLADQSARTMLSGRGRASHDRAEHLRAEMEKLMGRCTQCQGGMGGEFAARLRLMHRMMAGDTFSQMAQCRTFGFELGQGRGIGGGGMGMAGFLGMGSSRDGPSASLLGGESMLGKTGPESANLSDGLAEGTPSPDVSLSEDSDGDGEGRPRALNRPSRSPTGDLILDEYGDLVDAYFDKLTTTRNRKETP